MFRANRLACRIRMALEKRHLEGVHLIVGLVAGIGFTMALFISQLAFPPGPLLEAAKLGILCGSGFAGLLSLFIGHRILKTVRSPRAAATDAEAEASTSA